MAQIPSPWPLPLPRELQKKPVNAFSIRKAKKDHGIAKWIEGDLAPGDRVVVIDDVATTGGSTIKAIERAREEGLVVDRAVVLVDRQEGGIGEYSRARIRCARHRDPGRAAGPI